MSGCAVEQRVNLAKLTTRQLFDWLWVTMCRDAAGGVNWHDVRKAMANSLDDFAVHVTRQQGRTSERLDPDTWGTTPEQQAEMAAAMRLAGG